MSPVLLGDLPTDQPMPTGRVQRRLGVVEAMATWPAAGGIFQAGDGNMMVSVRSPYACYWVVQASFIAINQYTGWTRADAALLCQPADALGYSLSHLAMAASSGVSWHSYSLSAVWRLLPNTDYNCYLYSASSDGYTQYYQAGRHLCLTGYTLGEGTL